MPEMRQLFFDSLIFEEGSALSSDQLASVLISLAILIACGHFLGHVCVRFRQPRLIGEIVVGVALGPFVLGKFVKNALISAPSCVVAFWHHPTLWEDEVDTGMQPIWSLLANNGGDLVLNGHKHSMAVYQPLDADLQLGGHMVEIVSGAGGHKVGGAGRDSSGRLTWAQGKTAGVLYLTLNGANNGGTATSISWTFEDVSGNPLSGSEGSVACR
jgi:hypothetical protein